MLHNVHFNVTKSPKAGELILTSSPPIVEVKRHRPMLDWRDWLAITSFVITIGEKFIQIVGSLFRSSQRVAR